MQHLHRKWHCQVLSLWVMEGSTPLTNTPCTWFASCSLIHLFALSQVKLCCAFMAPFLSSFHPHSRGSGGCIYCICQSGGRGPSSLFQVCIVAGFLHWTIGNILGCCASDCRVCDSMLIPSFWHLRLNTMVPFFCHINLNAK